MYFSTIWRPISHFLRMWNVDATIKQMLSTDVAKDSLLQFSIFYHDFVAMRLCIYMQRTLGRFYRMNAHYKFLHLILSNLILSNLTFYRIN